MEKTEFSVQYSSLILSFIIYSIIPQYWNENFNLITDSIQQQQNTSNVYLSNQFVKEEINIAKVQRLKNVAKK